MITYLIAIGGSVLGNRRRFGKLEPNKNQNVTRPLLIGEWYQRIMMSQCPEAFVYWSL